MRWFHSRRLDQPQPATASTVGTVVRPELENLTGQTAAAVVAQVIAAGDVHVVIDLSDVQMWDSDGIERITNLADGSLGRICIEGLAAANERILGLQDGDSGVHSDPSVAISRVRQVLVVRPLSSDSLRDETLESLVTNAVTDATTVVIDLGSIGSLDPTAIQSLGFASSAPALRDLETLIVNANGQVFEELRRAGLPLRTWLAPSPEQPTPPAAWPTKPH